MAKEQLDEYKIKNVPVVKHKGKQATVPTVVKDGKVYSRYNALKHGKYAKIPIYCNDCVYRSKDVGGNGRCLAYEKDSICGIREDIQKHCGKLDSRNPDDLKTVVDEQVRMLRERVLFAIWQAGVDGNLMDRSTNAQMNTLMTYLRFARELQGTLKVTEVQDRDANTDAITKLFREVSIG